MTALRRAAPLVAAALLALGALAFGAALGARKDAAPATRAGAPDWIAALIAPADEGFARFEGRWRLDLPADHGPHPAAQAETWTVTAQLADDGGEPVGLQLSFARLALSPPDASGGAWSLRAVRRAHATRVDAGLAGPAGAERLARGAAGEAGEEAGAVWLDDWSLAFGADGAMMARAAVGDAAATLRLTPVKPAVAVAPEGQAPFRGYALPRLSVEGHVDGPQGRRALSGVAWLDHLWGDLPPPGGPIARDRLLLHLDDGSDLSVLRTRRRDGGGVAAAEGVAIAPDGAARAVQDLSMIPTRLWIAPDGSAWPVGWRLEGSSVSLTVEPVVEDALHGFAEPMWSGPVRGTGMLDGRAVAGPGALNLTGYGAP